VWCVGGQSAAPSFGEICAAGRVGWSRLTKASPADRLPIEPSNCHPGRSVGLRHRRLWVGTCPLKHFSAAHGPVRHLQHSPPPNRFLGSFPGIDNLQARSSDANSGSKASQRRGTGSPSAGREARRRPSAFAYFGAARGMGDQERRAIHVRAQDWGTPSKLSLYLAFHLATGR
jgi:hypothetical protein